MEKKFLSWNLWPRARYLHEGECFILYYGIAATAVTCCESRNSVVGIVIRLRPGRTKYHISICGMVQFFFIFSETSKHILACKESPIY
jgi:hypothetical protein